MALERLFAGSMVTAGKSSHHAGIMNAARARGKVWYVSRAGPFLDMQRRSQ